MDKFGVFKLLNSFFEFYKENGSNLPKNLSGVLDGLTGKAVSTSPTENTKPKTPVKPRPLTSMLDSMKTHDEFVSRVTKSQIKNRD